MLALHPSPARGRTAPVLDRAYAAGLPLAAPGRGYVVTTARWQALGSQWFWTGATLDLVAGQDVMLLVAPAPGMTADELRVALRAAVRQLLSVARCVRVRS